MYNIFIPEKIFITLGDIRINLANPLENFLNEEGLVKGALRNNFEKNTRNINNNFFILKNDFFEEIIIEKNEFENYTLYDYRGFEIRINRTYLIKLLIQFEQKIIKDNFIILKGKFKYAVLNNSDIFLISEEDKYFEKAKEYSQKLFKVNEKKIVQKKYFEYKDKNGSSFVFLGVFKNNEGVRKNVYIYCYDKNENSVRFFESSAKIKAIEEIADLTEESDFFEECLKHNSNYNEVDLTKSLTIPLTKEHLIKLFRDSEISFYNNSIIDNGLSYKDFYYVLGNVKKETFNLRSLFELYLGTLNKSERHFPRNDYSGNTGDCLNFTDEEAETFLSKFNVEVIIAYYYSNGRLHSSCDYYPVTVRKYPSNTSYYYK